MVDVGVISAGIAAIGVWLVVRTEGRASNIGGSVIFITALLGGVVVGGPTTVLLVATVVPAVLFFEWNRSR